MRQFNAFTATIQAFVQPVQRPEVPWMLAGSRRLGTVQRQTGFQCFTRAAQSWCLLFGRKDFPWLIVVRPDRISDAPMCKRAIGVDRQSFLKAFDRFFVVVSNRPDKAPIKPYLRLGRLACRAAVITKIKLLRHEC